MREIRRHAMAWAALLVVVPTAGCAQIPTSGGPVGAAVTQVADRPERDPAVRVFAEGPHPGDSVYSIVAGFLEASGTVDDGLSTAHEYLTAAAGARWRPRNGVSVYDQTAVRLSAKSTDRLEFSAPASGTVDDQGVFLEAAPGRSLMADFGLVKVDGNWRIDSLPDGLFVSHQDFDREYAALDLHFLAAGKATPVLVPDPIHLRRDAELPTALAGALLRGPSRWLTRAVNTAVPAGSALDGPVTVTAGVAAVRLTPASVPPVAADRDNLLGQLVMTMTEDPDITGVAVSVDGRPVLQAGRGATQLSRAEVAGYLPADLRPPSPSAYCLRDAVSYFVGPSGAQGPFGPSTQLAEIALVPGGTVLAGISKDRSTLWTAPLAAPDRLNVVVNGVGLSSISFDQDGNLWVLDGPSEARVLRRVAPNGLISTANVSGFDAGRIHRLRVSADGTRMALVLDTAEGAAAYLALVTGADLGLNLGSPRRLGYELVNALDIGWAQPDRLTVLAADRDAAPEPFALTLGGTATEIGPSLADVTGLAVAPGQALIATTSTKLVYRLRSGTGGWFQVGTGSFAAYPG